MIRGIGIYDLLSSKTTWVWISNCAFTTNWTGGMSLLKLEYTITPDNVIDSIYRLYGTFWFKGNTKNYSWGSTIGTFNIPSKLKYHYPP